MKNRNIFNTLIIGAGPSGTAAAISLQKAGISNIIIDNKKFPREKVCGGLVTNKSIRTLMRLLDMTEFKSISEAFCDHSDKVELYYENRRLTSSKLSKRLFFVKREKFDNFLVEHYKKMGGILLDGESGYLIDYDKKEVTLKNGEVINYQKLILADGALSPNRQKLGYVKPKLGFCIEAYVSKKMLQIPNRVRIYFGLIKNGYGWIFPSGDEYCIGLGGTYSEDIKYIKLIRTFVRMLNIKWSDCRVRGAFVPYGELTYQSLGHSDIIFVGDAGGFVDPIYGEGIYFALSSGIEAAQACIEGSANIKDKFLANMSPYTTIIKQGSRLQKIFFNKFIQKVFKTKVYKKNRFVAFYCDNQVSEYKYSYNNLIKLHRDYKKAGKYNVVI